MQFSSRSPDCIVETFLAHFRQHLRQHQRQQQPVSPSWPRAYFDDDDGVGDGVTREAFSLFWEAAYGRMFQTQGGDLSLPIISPTFNSQLWEIVGIILAYTVAVLGQFPIRCISEVVCRALLGLPPDEDEEILINDFLSTLGERERELLSPLYFYEGEHLSNFVASRRADILEILREFSVSTLPPTREIRSLIVNTARHSLLEVPRAAITAMESGFHSVTGNFFSQVSGRMVSSWYQQQRRPVFEEICARLYMESDEEDAAGRVFDLLVGFLREHREDEDLLRRFLRYSTGTSNARGDRIRVEIRRDNRFITHETCFSSIRLPLIEDTREAEEAFLVQLLHELSESSSEWSFNSG